MNGRVKSSFSSKLFQNNIGSLLSRECSPFVCTLGKSVSMEQACLMSENFLGIIDQKHGVSKSS